MADQRLVIVRRGHFATFELLTRTFAGDPDVQIIWDRRMGDGRQSAGAPDQQDHSGDKDRRRVPPTQWSQLNYMFAQESKDR